MISAAYWSVDDVLAKRCSLADVGTRKARVEAPAEVVSCVEVDDLPERVRHVPSAILKRDALAAYKSLGGADYLRSQPDLLNKLLLKLLPTEVSQSVEMRGSVVIAVASPQLAPGTLDVAPASAPTHDATTIEYRELPPDADAPAGQR
jgi:hypothetical protein